MRVIRVAVISLQIIALLFLFAAILATWFFWPFLVALALGKLPALNPGCIEPTVLGQIGDTYGSLNSLLTMILGAVALLTLRMQYRQLRDMNLQNIKMNALTLLSSYFALDPQEALDQRSYLLYSFLLQIAPLSEQVRSELVNSVHPTKKELEKLRLDNLFGRQISVPPSWANKKPENPQ